MPGNVSSKKLAGVIIVIVIVVMLFLPIVPVSYEATEPRQRTETYVEKEPYQVTKTESVKLLDDKPTVSAGKAIYYHVYIDIAGKERNVVSGSVVETAGYDINFYVFDQKGYNAWKEGRSTQAYVSAKRINSYSYSFVPDHSDYYYFVLDNGYSWFTNKVPQITAAWNYQIIVTEWREVQKTKTITEYVKITKTEYETPLTALLRGLR